MRQYLSSGKSKEVRHPGDGHYIKTEYKYNPKCSVDFEDPMSFDFGKYDSQNSKGEVVPFADRFKSTYFQNVYGKRNGSSLAVCEKEISLIMKLQYPFVVDVK